MNAASVFSVLKPSVTSLGYALFLAVNAAGVWGGVFPFLPLDFQTHEIVLRFFLAQSLVFAASFLASAVGVYFLPGPTRTFLVKLASAPYAAGWAALIAAIYLDDFALALVTLGGALLGLGSAGFYMLWQRLFASQDPEGGTRDLVAGSAYAALLYFSLYLIPQAVTAFLIPLVFLPLFGLCIALKSREISLDQPMFEDVPREHPQVYRRILRDFWRSALSVGTLGFCSGVMRSLAVADPQVGSLVNIMSMEGMLVAALALLFAWRFRNVRLNVIGMYRMAFPFIVTSFLLLPLLPAAYQRWLAAILYAAYSAALMIMMAQCAQVSRDRGVNPVFVYGFFGAVVYALHDIGFVSGTFAEAASFIGVSPDALVALVALYLLGVMHFVGSGGFAHAAAREAADVEFVALGAPEPARKAAEAKAGAAKGAWAKAGEAPAKRRVTKAGTAAKRQAPGQKPPAAASPAPLAERRQAAGAGHAARKTAPPAAPGPDRIAAQAQALREHYRLTAREAEIMELIARGNTVARIAEMLVVSENTVRTHSKRIYVKLDIHKKQELVDLIEAFTPAR
ncbi:MULTISPECIES: helix-turn-helix transcriptional regulator [unclassified Adlercreutzia]|uniref:helix-turn-helix transcriptional regulator n=1 Tax=unclassified Adlercreutzia TaxID=2636013 RepID=UPI001F14B9B6|nr:MULTISPECIES: helix-turn-helix transcriptional regulator [unclassified Adlercreutzia]